MGVFNLQDIKGYLFGIVSVFTAAVVTFSVTLLYSLDSEFRGFPFITEAYTVSWFNFLLVFFALSFGFAVTSWLPYVIGRIQVWVYSVGSSLLLLHVASYALLQSDPIAVMVFISSLSVVLGWYFGCGYYVWSSDLRSIWQHYSKTFPRLDVWWLVVGLVTSIMFLYASLDHYTFQSVSWDFGDYDQAVWLLSQFKAPNNTVIGVNNLGDHFELPLVYLAPLYWVWSSPYALLLAQSIAIALAIVPLKILGLMVTRSKLITACIIGAYVAFFGIQSAVEFEFHPIVMALPFIAYAFLFLYREQYLRLCAMLFLIATTKENLAIYTLFFGLYLLLFRFRNAWKWGAGIVIGSAIYFLMLTQIIMPQLAGGVEYIHFDYDQFGSTYSEAAQYAVTHPWFTVTTLFSPEIKVQTIMLIAGSFGFVWLFTPVAFLTIPLFLERFLNSLEHIWRPYFQYSAILTPYLVVGVFLFIAYLYRWGARRNGLWAVAPYCVAFAVLLSSVLYSWRGMLHPFFLWELVNGEIYPSQEQQQSINTTLEAVRVIPDGASVLAQDAILPHVSQREVVYLFDEVNDDKGLEYVIINPKYSYWPSDKEEYQALIRSFLVNADYGIIYSQDTALVLQRNAVATVPLSDEMKTYLVTPSMTN